MEAALQTFDVALHAVEIAIAIVGGIWVYKRFRHEGAAKPRIEFDVRCRFLGPIQDAYVAAFEVHAKNCGLVEHRFQEIRLKVLAIRSDATLQMWQGHEPRLLFPEQLVRGVNLVPRELGYYFVRPGVDQSFSYVIPIPKDLRFLVARATFLYEATGDLHTAERVFEVRPDAPVAA